jgi:hypothetical protein
VTSSLPISWKVRFASGQTPGSWGVSPGARFEPLSDDFELREEPSFVERVAWEAAMRL